MSATTIEITGLDGGTVSLGAEQVDALRSRLGAPVLTAGDDGWDDAIRIWNAMAARTPALVAQPETPEGVAEAVRFAGEHGLLLGVKGGGHHIAGTCIAEGGLTLDMARMRDVVVDPGARLAHVSPGCRLRDVDRATQRHGLATTLGFISKVGVAGLTLGGGFGYLSRRFGWAVDNLEEVEIVTADGRVRTATRRESPDLFWAVRGGGGNFGVVTQFTFRVHEVGPAITGGLAAWGAERAEEVLSAYHELTSGAPRELTAALIVRCAPPAPFIAPEWHGRPIVGVLVCHTGPDPEADLAPLRALRGPVFDLVAERPYAEQQSMLDDTDPDGMHQYWKTEYLPGLSEEYLGTFLDAALSQTSPLSFSVIFPIGGALNERQSDDGAVGNRDARFISGFSTVWPPDDPRGDEHVAWTRRSWEAIRPYSTGGNYVNFQLAEDEAQRTAAAYGRNYERLREVKAVYDPGNLFRRNRNILPAG